jgi:hypothetical protein
MTQTSKKPVDVKAKLSLPSDYNEPSDDFREYWQLIFGRKNVGKTSLGASYPDSLTFQLERGRKNLSIRMVPAKNEKPLTYKTLKNYLELFCAADGDEYRIAVFDTIDAMYEICYNFVMQNYGVVKPSDTGDGPGVWNEIKETFDGLIAMVQDAGKVGVFISHEKAKDHKNADGTVLERIEPSCTGQAISAVQRYCDYVFHYDFCVNDRVVTIRSTDNNVWTSCGRNETFLDPDGSEIKRLLIPSGDPTEGYSVLERGFRNELRDYDYVPPKKPTSPAKKTTTPAKKK